MSWDPVAWRATIFGTLAVIALLLVQDALLTWASERKGRSRFTRHARRLTVLTLPMLLSVLTALALRIRGAI